METNARRQYRRGTDNAYEPVAAFLAVLNDSTDLGSLEGEMLAMRERINKEQAEQTVPQLKALAKQFSAIKGADKIKSKISKARRALGKKKPKVDKALKLYDDAIEEFDQQMIWRGRAASELYAGLSEYEQAIRGTLGIRQQMKMPEELALFVAGCASGHRDISLNF